MNEYFDTLYDWWKNIDKSIFFLICIFFLLGLFFSLASTSIIASDKLNTNSYYFFLKHFSFVAIGVIIILLFSLLNQKILINLSILLFLFALITLFLVPLIGVEVKGSKRWLDVGVLPRFQPIETLNSERISHIFAAKNSDSQASAAQPSEHRCAARGHAKLATCRDQP